jgi:hypothetical protein
VQCTTIFIQLERLPLTPGTSNALRRFRQSKAFGDFDIRHHVRHFEIIALSEGLDSKDHARSEHVAFVVPGLVSLSQ